MVASVLAATPVLLTAFAWREWTRTPAPSAWRRWLALFALLCGTLGALAQPTVFLVLSVHQRISWLNRTEASTINWVILVGFAASLLGIPLASCAWGKVRWLTLPACALSLALCYISALATSY